MTQNRRAILGAGGALAATTLAAGAGLAPALAATMSPGSLPGRKVKVNGVTYHVGELGRGDKVVVMLHGMPDTSGVWRHQAQALASAGYRVFAPDMLGYGETDKPTETARYAGENILADMVALLDTLSISRADIVGHDWGAYASWELAISFPQRFRRHVTVSQGHPDTMLTPRSVGDVKANWYMYLDSQEDTAELYAANDGEWLRKIFLPTHPEVDEVWSRMKDPRAMHAMLNWDRANPMASLYLAVAKGLLTKRQCAVPTLGVWSAGDAYLWESQMKESAKSMAAPWRYARLESGSHWPQLDHPQEISALILDWLNQA